MDVSVRELRNHTARVVSAIESGETVVLTVHGRPVADIVPREERSERRSSEVIMRELEAMQERWRRAGVRGDPDDYDVGLTTDDL
jgi:prevent-host-death family protein